MRKTLTIVVLLGQALGFSTAHGQANVLKLAGIFGDHMVLQQQTTAPIWGKANKAGLPASSFRTDDWPARE